MKRLALLGAVLAAIAAAIVGCGDSGDSSGTAANPGTESEASSKEDVTLTMWSEWSEEPAKAWSSNMIKEFESAHPNISIDHRQIGNAEFFTVVRTGISSGEPPDLLQTEANNNLFQLVPSGELADISSWFDEEGNGSRFIPTTIRAVTYEGKQYAVPLYSLTGTQIYYNKKLLSENNIDGEALSTWEDYLNAFEELKANGVTPIAYGNQEGWPGEQWLNALMVRNLGASRINQLAARNCNYKWTDPDVVKSAEYYEELLDNGYMTSGAASDNYPAAIALFFAEKAAFFQTGSWFVGNSAAEAPPGFEMGMSLFPTLPGGKGGVDENIVSTQGALSMSREVSEDPAKKEAALEFMDWITSRSAQEEGQEAQPGYVSAVKGVEGKVDALTSQIIEEQVAGSTDTTPFLVAITPNGVSEGELWSGGTAVASGQKDAMQWMEGIESAAAKEPPVLKIPAECSE